MKYIFICMLVFFVRLSHTADNFGDTNEAVKLTSAEQYVFQIKRGEKFIQLNQFENALSAFGMAININANEKMAYDYRGCLFLSLGEHEKALKDFSELVKLDPSDLRAYLNRGNAFRGNHNYSKAISDFDNYLLVIHTNAIAYNSRASALISMDQFRKAILDCTSSLKLSPLDPKVHVMRGIAHSQLGEYENALRDFTKALQLDETNPEPHNQIAWIKATCPDAVFRDGKFAVTSAIKACELTAWKNVHNLDTLAAAYAEANDFSNAIKHQKQALKLNLSDDQFDVQMQHRLAVYEKSLPFRDDKNWKRVGSETGRKGVTPYLRH